jgi:hypothetical protein
MPLTTNQLIDRGAERGRGNREGGEGAFLANSVAERILPLALGGEGGKRWRANLRRRDGGRQRRVAMKRRTVPHSTGEGRDVGGAGAEN